MKRYTIAFSLTLLFILAFFLYVPLEELKQRLLSIEPLNLALAFVSYTLSQAVRSLRWKALMEDLKISDAFLINSVNILFNNVLPARTGELSWFYYTNKLGINIKASLWYFFVAKLYDLMVLVILSLLSVYLVYRNLYILGLTFVFLWIALLLGRLYVVLPKWKKLKALRNFIQEKLSFDLSLKLTLLSSASIAFKFLGVYLLLKGDPLRLFLGFSAGELSSVMPFHNFMGYGTYEVSFSVPLKIFDVPIKSALIDGFLVHNFLLISSFLLGIPSFLFLHLRKR